MTSIKKELDKDQAVLAIIPPDRYTESCMRDLKELAKANSVCYITLNKTAESLKELCKEYDVNLKNIVFIDAITKTFSNVPYQKEQVYYISSPSALAELSIAIEKLLKHNYNYFVIDSLTNFLVYQKSAKVIKFLSCIVKKIKKTKKKVLLYVVSIKEQEDLMKACVNLKGDIFA